MTWWLSASVLFGVLPALFLVGLPAAFSFFGINIVGAWVYLGKEAGLIQLIRNGIVSITSFSLTPIPFFILMGEVLFHTGVAMKAIDAIDRLIWRVPGRLAVVAVVAGTLFSAISGSTIATTALLVVLLLICGFGWSASLLRVGWVERIAFAPAFGAASLTVAGLVIARAGAAMQGAPMIAAAIVAAGGGWVVMAVKFVVARRRADPTEEGSLSE